MQIRLTPRRTLGIVVPIIVFLTVISLAGQYWRLALHHHAGHWIVRQFNLDDELNIPTAYQAITLGCCALLLWTIAWRERQLKRRHIFQWALLGCIFLLLANDEAFRIHERLGQFRDDLPWGLGREFRTGWVMFGLLFVGVVGLIYLPFLYRLPRRFALLFMVAGAIYVGGAVGMEVVEDPWVEAHGRDNMHYQLMSTLEEDMEMTGIALFLFALTSYLAPFQSRLLRVDLDAPKTSDIAAPAPATEPAPIA
jgi:hypothetical protein